jgi:hypothetical protein
MNKVRVAAGLGAIGIIALGMSTIAPAHADDQMTPKMTAFAADPVNANMTCGVFAFAPNPVGLMLVPAAIIAKAAIKARDFTMKQGFSGQEAYQIMDYQIRTFCPDEMHNARQALDDLTGAIPGLPIT